MAEQLSHQPEQQPAAEQLAEDRQSEKASRHHKVEADKHLEAEQQHSAEQALARAKQEAISGKDMSVEKTRQAATHGTSPLVDRELRRLMFKRTLVSVQKQLSAPSRAFSKVVHNPAIDRASAAAEKTVARPKGILVGGLAAFIGCLYTLYLAKHYGFRYNLLLFIILFVTGYVVTTFIEIAAIVIKRTFRH
jgi:hypothetical protein